MTINEIFKEIEYGKEYCLFEATKDSIERAYDKDTDIFYASKRIKDIAKKVALNEEDEKIIDRISNKCEIVEDRLFAETVMSPAYKKLTAATLYEECEKIQNKTKKRGDYAALKGAEALGKIIATTKYFVESYLDDKAILKECYNVQFNRFIKDELYNIEQVL
jgi:hypothetical protein